MCQADGEDDIDAGFFAECCDSGALVAALHTVQYLSSSITEVAHGY